jgi:hypothetical protein
MGKITIRKSKDNPDVYEVTGGGRWKNVRTMSKSHAIDIAEARRRLRKKR